MKNYKKNTTNTQKAQNTPEETQSAKPKSVRLPPDEHRALLNASPPCPQRIIYLRKLKAEQEEEARLERLNNPPPPPQLKPLPIPDLTEVKTIYKEKFKTVMFKINPKINTRHIDKQKSITCSNQVIDVLDAMFERLDDAQEHMLLLSLNNLNKITGFKVICSGGQNYVVLDCKVLFRSAMVLGAASIIVAQNRPYGNTEPSPAELKLTRKLVRAGDALDIKLMDHIIYTPYHCRSIASEKEHLFLLPDECVCF